LLQRQATPGPDDLLQKSLLAEAAEAQISRARRMEIVGQLTGGIVHDFNNPHRHLGHGPAVAGIAIPA